MLKVDCNGKKMVVAASGDLKEITANIAHVISDLYSHIYIHDPGAAEAFRVAMVGIITDPRSPVWDRNGDHGTGVIVPKK